MTTSSNAATIKRFYEAVNAKKTGQDIDLAAFFTEDVVWHLPRSSPIHGSLVGRRAVVDLFDGPVDDYYQAGSLQFDYRTEICQGDNLAMQFTMSAVTAAGDPYENDYCIIFRFRNGQIAEAREFFDTAALFSMFQPAS